MLPQQVLALLAAAEAMGDATALSDPARLRTGVLVGIGLDPNTTQFHGRWAVEQHAPSWAELRGIPAEGAAFEAWSRGLATRSAPPSPPIARWCPRRTDREPHRGNSDSAGPASRCRARKRRPRRVRDRRALAPQPRARRRRRWRCRPDRRLPPRPRRASCRDSRVRRADAAVALVLKRLADAQRDGDRIYGIVSDPRNVPGGELDRDDPVDLDADSPRPGTRHAVSERRAARMPRPAAATGHAGAAEGLVCLVSGLISLYQQILPRPTTRTAGSSPPSGSVTGLMAPDGSESPPRASEATRWRSTSSSTSRTTWRRTIAW
ncbi:MAG: hypothetical protein U0794_07410 [Isosphaeraceae bacterium]